MESHVKCYCQSDENHREISCFFKYVVFLLKRFVSSLNLLQMDRKDARNEILKNHIWMQIAAQYDDYFTGKILVGRCINIQLWMLRLIIIRKMSSWFEQIVTRTALVWMVVLWNCFKKLQSISWKFWQGKFSKKFNFQWLFNRFKFHITKISQRTTYQ